MLLQQVYIFICILAFVKLICGDLDNKHPTLLTVKFNSRNKNFEFSTQYWIKKAQNALADKLEVIKRTKPNTAKNIIMFLGDGMSVHTITATRNFIRDSGEQLYFEKFPYVGLSKTYCLDRQVADSACTATAYLCGVKSNYGTIGVNGHVTRSDCFAGQNRTNWVDSIVKWAQNSGKDTGLVTTTRVTHASPAGLYAHTAERNWENDKDVKNSNCDPNNTIDIARQLIEWPVGQNLKVIMGGGRENFYNITQYDEQGAPGKRTDGRNLIKHWLEDKRLRNLKASYVSNRAGLNSINPNNTDYVLGLFSGSHCPYHGDIKRKNLTYSHPSLSEMTMTALNILQKNRKGFFLFVEGGRIDMAHHETKARKSLEDTKEFSKAVRLARKMFSEDDTLILVTSDHSHTMTINGYPERKKDIAGLSYSLGDDNLPYTILSYANGLGYYNTYSVGGRKEITAHSTRNPDFQYLSTTPLKSETHGGDDVAVFASGPYAHYFSGNYEQSHLPTIMATAFNVGPYKSHLNIMKSIMHT